MDMEIAARMETVREMGVESHNISLIELILKESRSMTGSLSIRAGSDMRLFRVS